MASSMEASVNDFSDELVVECFHDEDDSESESTLNDHPNVICASILIDQYIDCSDIEALNNEFETPKNECFDKIVSLPDSESSENVETIHFIVCDTDALINDFEATFIDSVILVDDAHMETEEEMSTSAYEMNFSNEKCIEHNSEIEIFEDNLEQYVEVTHEDVASNLNIYDFCQDENDCKGYGKWLENINMPYYSVIYGSETDGVSCPEYMRICINDQEC